MSLPEEIVFTRIHAYALSQFRCGSNSVHGLQHWRNVDDAIRHHVDGKVSDDPTIGACWDADRLDLGRVGIVPAEKYMSTRRGKELARGTS